MEIVLEAKGLGKTYVVGKNNEHEVLKNVNLQIKKGEFVSVMGPSGSGKSTLLYNLSGMDILSSGSVVFNGKEISRLSERDLSELRLNEMGFIFQHIHLLKNLCIYDNIILSAYLSNNKSRKNINEMAEALMKKAGILELANNDISEASGGQLQRAAVCRALMNEPHIIFGDEPTGALNSKSANDIMEMLADINKEGTAILLVTHDVKVAAKTERILYMLDGQIVGEKRLSKYQKGRDDMKDREERLTRWLREMDF
ncbi:ABC transporter ATP-binding protein [Bacillus sp. IITD106]|nr:ABC transporter ATP-binding protein [Bacillus sp. IITD106]